MTKKELIEALKDFPDDAIVTRTNVSNDDYRQYTDYFDLEEVNYNSESNKIILY